MARRDSTASNSSASLDEEPLPGGAAPPHPEADAEEAEEPPASASQVALILLLFLFFILFFPILLPLSYWLWVDAAFTENQAIERDYRDRINTQQNLRIDRPITPLFLRTLLTFIQTQPDRHFTLHFSNPQLYRKWIWNKGFAGEGIRILCEALRGARNITQITFENMVLPRPDINRLIETLRATTGLLLILTNVRESRHICDRLLFTPPVTIPTPHRSPALAALPPPIRAAEAIAFALPPRPDSGLI